MKAHKIDGSEVVLIPAYDGALSLGVGPSDDGLLRALLTVRTADLGDFIVVLTKHDLGLLAAVSRTLLNLNGTQAAELYKQLTQEGNQP